MRPATSGLPVLLLVAGMGFVALAMGAGVDGGADGAAGFIDEDPKPPREALAPAFEAWPASAGVDGAVGSFDVEPRLSEGPFAAWFGAGDGVADFATSCGLFAPLCPNPEKPVVVGAGGLAASGLAPKPENPFEPKAGLAESCCNEKGFSLFDNGALDFSGEAFGVWSELLSGAEARGELLLGVLEPKPRKVPLVAGLACVLVPSAEGVSEALSAAFAAGVKEKGAAGAGFASDFVSS